MLNRRHLLAAAGGASVTGLLPGSANAQPKSDLKPFAKGDIFAGSTLMDHPTDDHMGTGRILQYDADLNLKGTLYTEGTQHHVGGFNFAPDGTLWAFSAQTPTVVEVSPDGMQKPVRSFSDRTFSNVTFAKDGSLYFGEHLTGAETSSEFNTTVFNYLPGRDVIGDGWIYKYSPEGELLQTFECDVHGGMAGFLAVTSSVLMHDETRIIYVSETGNRVMQYDIATDQQLPDLKVFQPSDGVFMVIGLCLMPDGRVVVTSGTAALVLDPSTGEIMDNFDLGGAGWAACMPAMNGRDILVGNYFTGDLVILEGATGQVLNSGNVGEAKSLSGVAQFAG